MNKFKTTIISILGGIEILFTIISPVLICWLWIFVFGTGDWKDYLIFGIGLITTFFRGIKKGFGGFFK